MRGRSERKAFARAANDVRRLKQLSPALPVLARVNRGADIARVREAGADMVFYAEFEAAMVMIRDTLGRLHVPAPEIQSYTAHLRQARYTEPATGAAGSERIS